MSVFQNQEGFLLIEVLLAVAILAIGLTLVVQAYLAAFKAEAYTSGYTEAMILAQNEMEEIIQKYREDAIIPSEGAFPSPYESISYTVDIHPYPSDENLMECVLTVSWNRGRRKNRVVTGTLLEAKREKIEE